MGKATIVALFDTFEAAKSATDDLVKTGTPKDRIDLLCNSASGDHPGLQTNPSFDRPAIEAEPEAASGLGAGVAIGAGLGGVIGVLLGAGLLVIPGIGPVLAAGAWISIAAGIAAGAVAGGVVGALIDHGVSPEDAELYAEGLRRGGTLVSVHAASDQLDRIAQILEGHRAVDIEKRAASWRAEGWVGFSREAQPLSAVELAALRERELAAGHEVRHHRAIRRYAKVAEPAHLAGISNKPGHYADDMLKR